MTRRISLLLTLLGLIGLSSEMLSASEISTGGARPNVLFIAVDDLRTSLGCYGDTLVKSPNIDQLACESRRFTRSYCHQAVCGPSRNSILTGRLPDNTRVWHNRNLFRDTLPDGVTLPEYFKNHGYHAQSLGKVFSGRDRLEEQDPQSWSVPPLLKGSGWSNYALEENRGHDGKGVAAEMADVPDEGYSDGKLAALAVQTMEDLAERKQPFFLAVGFFKPHLPFCAPKKYWDLYDPTQFELTSFTDRTHGAPEVAYHEHRELGGYQDVPKDEKFGAKKTRHLRHGYYACVSFVDANVGRLLDRLEKLGIADNTVICLWGDHGFHLGEQGLWTKANNYELSTRVPLIFSVPGQANPGSKTNALVEFVDVYPTLADICGLDAPVGVEGVSLKPLLADPDRPWKSAAFSQYPRSRTGNRHRGHGDIMGYAVRTDRHRYVEWREWETRQLVARELYDHAEDPHEMHNIAEQPGQSAVVRRLADVLEAGWPAAVPKDEAIVEKKNATGQVEITY